jgi:hypothetical protein
MVAVITGCEGADKSDRQSSPLHSGNWLLLLLFLLLLLVLVVVVAAAAVVQKKACKCLRLRSIDRCGRFLHGFRNFLSIIFLRIFQHT